jgi:hypothetical protein
MYGTRWRRRRGIVIGMRAAWSIAVMVCRMIGDRK